MPDETLFRTALAALADDYEVERELGRGGTAVVYAARDRALARTVALKVVVPDAADVDAIDRLAREARTAAQLVHPNIVAVHAVRRLPGDALALVLQFVPGPTLRAMLLDRGAMDISRAIRALADVARGLEHAHVRGVVHGDVKPENVLVDASTGRALLSDFGSATGGDPERQERAVLAGTPAYMAPEQIAGQAVDARSDVYSLGLLGWELLTGLQPFGHGSPREILERRRFMSPPPIRDVRPDVPTTLADTIQGAIQADPDARWPSAAAFLAALAEPPRSGVFGRWRRPAGARAIGPVPAAVVSADTMVWDRAVPPLAPEPGQPASIDDSPEFAPVASRRRGLRVAVAAGVLLAAGAVWAIGTRVGLGDDASAASASAPPAVAMPEDRQGTEVPFADSAQLAAADSALADSGLAAFDSVNVPPAETAAPVQRESFGQLAPEAPRSVAAAPPARRTPARQPAPFPRQSAPPPRLDVPATIPVAPAMTPSSGNEPAAARGTGSARMLAAGGQHSCLLDANGSAYCWGSNSGGQLGGRGARTGDPVAVGGGLRFTAISAGGAFSCGVTGDRQVWCWGQNDRGQLGDGSRIDRRAPVRVAVPGTLRALSTGLAHACALDSAGAAWCWGANDRGQAGVGSAERDALTPSRVGGDAMFRAIAGGWQHTCALDTRERPWCWGRNDDGRLGDGTTADQPEPVLVADAPRLTSLVAGGTHSCALTASGQGYCWGRNVYGQLGDGTLATTRTPVRVRAVSNFASLTAGSTHTCGLTTAGEAHCWGRNAYGQLGDASTTDRATPTLVQGGFRFRQLHASGAHTCGATREGLSLCWGYNVQGQLGDGSRSNSPRPVAVAAPTD